MKTQPANKFRFGEYVLWRGMGKGTRARISQHVFGPDGWFYAVQLTDAAGNSTTVNLPENDLKKLPAGYMKEMYGPTENPTATRRVTDVTEKLLADVPAKYLKKSPGSPLTKTEAFMFDDIIERGGVNLGFHSKPLLYALPRWGILKTRAVWSLLHRGKFRVYLVESNVPGANFETLRLPLDQASIGTFYDGASPGAELNPSRARKTKARKLHKLPLDKRATQTKSGRVMCTGCDRMLARSQARAKVPGNRRDLVQGHGLCKPCAAEQIAEFKRGFAARKKNPPAELSSAAALSESFNGKAPRKVTAVNIRWPRALMHVGPCAQLDYISKKWDGVLRQYFHEFKGRCDVFAAPNAMPDGDGLLIIKGKFKIKPEGITG